MAFAGASKLFSLGVLSAALLFAGAFGVGAEDKVVDTKMKSITGTIGHLTGIAINVTYESKREGGVEYEMALPFASDVEFEGRDRSRLEYGDHVQVFYQETTREYGDNLQRSREAKRVRFLRKPGTGLRSGG